MTLPVSVSNMSYNNKDYRVVLIREKRFVRLVLSFYLPNRKVFLSSATVKSVKGSGRPAVKVVVYQK